MRAHEGQDRFFFDFDTQLCKSTFRRYRNELGLKSKEKTSWAAHHTRTRTLLPHTLTHSNVGWRISDREQHRCRAHCNHPTPKFEHEHMSSSVAAHKYCVRALHELIFR